MMRQIELKDIMGARSRYTIGESFVSGKAGLELVIYIYIHNILMKSRHVGCPAENLQSPTQGDIKTGMTA